MPAVRRGKTSIISTAIISTSIKPTTLAAAAVLLWGAAACGSQGSPATSRDVTSTSAASPSSSASSTPTTATYPGKSYDLGHSVVYRQAFQQFNGTGTPWEKACGSVVDEWQASVGAESWWNRDEVLRGCLDGGNDATGATAAKECAPQDGRMIRIYSGDINCADAYVITGRYDFNTGPKYQQIDSIDSWTCYTSIADLRPIILTCVSDKKAEFDVREEK